MRRNLVTTMLIVGWSVQSNAAEAQVDPSKLPSPASLTVDFKRDIQPIFENSCWRCHGPERPKSQFRLDNRESALKGGNNGVDIIPGNSAGSPLIHYVARLVPDMEMPPEGKGDPLTAEQIGVLRAWIDQGVSWGATNTGPQLHYDATPAFRFIGVEGDQQKFREVEGIREGYAGGLEKFSMQGWMNPQVRVGVTGRALFSEADEEVKTALTLEKQGVGFVRAGMEKWTRYYDNSGGYTPDLGMPELARDDLALDLGRAWVDLGLNKPGLPNVVLGYEYRFKEGAKSTLEWGPVGERNVYPGVAFIDERTHILKLDIAHEFGAWRLEDHARIEWHESRDERRQAAAVTPPATLETAVVTRNSYDHVQGMNSLRGERQLTDWWRLSGGYLYSKLSMDAAFAQATVDSAGNPVAGQFWTSADDGIELERQVHLFSLANQWLPVSGLSLSAGAQSQWMRQEGFGALHLDEGDPDVPQLFLLRPVTVRSDIDSVKWIEDIGIRYSRIPYTVFSADARFEQEDLSQFEEEAGEVSESFLRDTDATQRRWEARSGVSVSPWSWASLNVSYAGRYSDSDYDHVRRFVLEGDGYSAFITHRRIESDSVRARLSLRPLSWLRMALSYRRSDTDFYTTTGPIPGDITPGGTLQAGTSVADVYGISSTATLFRSLQISGAFTWTESMVDTAQNGVPAVRPYEGHVMSLLASVTYNLKGLGRLEGAYSFSDGDYGQDHFVDGLPLGLSFTRHGLTLGLTRRLSETITGSLRYRYYSYSEPSTGGGNDYTAHGVFASLAFVWR